MGSYISFTGSNYRKLNPTFNTLWICDFARALYMTQTNNNDDVKMMTTTTIIITRCILM